MCDNGEERAAGLGNGSGAGRAGCGGKFIVVVRTEGCISDGDNDDEG